MRIATLSSMLIPVMLAAAGCRTLPLGGNGGGGGNGPYGCGTGGECPADIGPIYDPDFGPPVYPDGGPIYTCGSAPGLPPCPWDLGPNPIDFPPGPQGDMVWVGHPEPCGRQNPDPGASDPFKRVKWAVAANWTGTVTDPWFAPYHVNIDFFPDGTYYAHTIDGSGQLPFYYDRDPEQDTYDLINLNSDGSTSGEIYLQWLTTPDTIEHLVVDDNFSHLKFDYFHFGYGPVHYELSCIP